VFITTDIKCEVCGELISHHSEEGFSCGPDCGLAILHESLMQILKGALNNV
jgi:hypothetical protein